MSILIEVESENYGKYNIECIGIVDFYLMSQLMSIDEFFEWTTKYHPVRNFRTHSLIALSTMNDEKLNSEFVRYALFVPSDESNKSWDSSYWCNKHNLGRKKRPLPIGYSNKSIFLWQRVNSSLFTPDYFIEAKCIEDLQINLPEIQSKRDIQRKTFLSDLNPCKSFPLKKISP